MEALLCNRLFALNQQQQERIEGIFLLFLEDRDAQCLRDSVIERKAFKRVGRGSRCYFLGVWHGMGVWWLWMDGWRYGVEYCCNVLNQARMGKLLCTVYCMIVG